MKLEFSVETSLVYDLDLSQEEWDEMTKSEQRLYVDNIRTTVEPTSSTPEGMMYPSVYVDGKEYDLDYDDVEYEHMNDFTQ